jgi:hypothetical protein
MRRIFPVIATAIALHALPAQGAFAPIQTRRIPSDITGVALAISCQPSPIAIDYEAETGSSIPLTDPYARARGADKGLITLKSEGDKRAKHYVIPRRSIQTLVRMTYDMDGLDRVDLVFTKARLVLIHTTGANAGIFTVSDIYEIPYMPDGRADRTALKDDEQLLHLLDVGLSFSQPNNGGCGRGRP